MAKSKRKISAAQRDKDILAAAKTLKKKGLLSKQTKLHGGKYVSKDVLKKVQSLRYAARPSYTSVKVTKDFAARAKAEDYEVVRVGNQWRVIVPKEHDFIKRIREMDKMGEGVSGLRPIKGGFMAEVRMPFTSKNTAELIEKLEQNGLDSLKLENEAFAFRFSGPDEGPLGMSYRVFFDTRSIIEHLRRYSPNGDTTGFKLFRLLPEDQRKFIKFKDERNAYKREHGIVSERKGARERPHGYKSRDARRRERLKRYDKQKYEALLAKEREKSAARYERQKQDPEWVKKSRERALKRYYDRKGKK